MLRRSLAAAGRLVSVLLWSAAAVVLLAYAAAYADHVASLLRFPYQADYGEMPELNRAWLLAHGRPIYTDWTEAPYQMANYPPLYSVLNALGVLLLGPQFFTGRLISVLSAVLSGACMAWLAYRTGGSWRPAGLVGLLFLAGHYVWNWSAFTRVDLLAVALSLLGLTLFVEGYVVRCRPRGAWLALPCFVAAAYTRQSMVAAAFACLGYLVLRDRRLGFRLIGAYVLAGVGILAALQLATGGQFVRHVVVGNANRFYWQLVFDQAEAFFRLYHWLLPLAAVFGVGAVATREGRRRGGVLLLYLLGALAIGVTAGKVGSNVNYLIEAWAALVLAAALGWSAFDRLAARAPVRPQSMTRDRLSQTDGRIARPRIPNPASSIASGWLRAMPALLLLVGLQQAYHVPHADSPLGPPWVWLRAAHLASPLWRLDPWGRPPSQVESEFPVRFLGNPGLEAAAAAAAAEVRVRNVPGDVLAEEMDFTVTTGKRVYLQPFEFSQLAEQAMWDQGPLLRDIHAARFPLVVLRFALDSDPGWHRERFTVDMLSAIASAYRHDATIGDYFLYVPRLPFDRRSALD